ncbi:MAG: hypothetical protein KKF54_07255, partial [Candidatus Omnitrophica bacterium]|nr:hypothetical protein [Candidatus Omnitrophota bacterium]
NSSQKIKKTIEKTLSKEKISKSDLLIMRQIITESGALEYAKNEITQLLKQALSLSSSLKMKPKYKQFLYSYPQNLMNK